MFSFLLFFFLFAPRKRDDENEGGAGEFLGVIFRMIFFYIITAIVRLIGILFIF